MNNYQRPQSGIYTERASKNTKDQLNFILQQEASRLAKITDERQEQADKTVQRLRDLYQAA